jgi:ribonuclease D
VSLTHAGLRLLDRLRPAFDQISGALEELNEERSRPVGRLRIWASPTATLMVVMPVWQRFLSTYPEVQLEIWADVGRVDIVASGFDAAIGSKDWVPSDMIGVRVTGPIKLALVGAPTYFAGRRPPRAPDDLASHNCIQYRVGAKGSLAKWYFQRNGKSRAAATPGRLTVNNTELALRAALDGLGIAYLPEEQAAPFLRTGQLTRVMEGLLGGDGRSLSILSRVPASSDRTASVHRHDPRHHFSCAITEVVIAGFYLNRSNRAVAPTNGVTERGKRGEENMTIRLHRGDLPDLSRYSGTVAVDTETMGLDHRRDRLCVVQLAPGDGSADVVQIPHGGPKGDHLRTLLANPNILKIFHFARFDLGVLMNTMGVMASPVYCTKIASRLARTYTDKHGLKDLTRDLLGIEVSKQQQLTDWGADDLTQAQIAYAAADVLHLHALKNKLDSMLAREGREELAAACFRFLPDRVRLDLSGWAAEDIFSHS